MSNPRRNALGRGLSALLENAATDITTTESKPVNSISEVPISQVEANPFQPRTDFKEEELNELAESIKVHGVIQPITVRKIGFDRYQLISGERRTRASRIAGLEKIPAYIRLADDQGMLEMALIENIQRENLNAIEIALSYKRLMEECDLKQEELGSRVGKSRSTVTNFMRLLKLPPAIQVAIRDNKLSMGHARCLIPVEDSDLQNTLFLKAISEEWSVRKLEDAVRQSANLDKSDKNQKGEDSIDSSDLKNYISAFSSFFNSPVSLKVNADGKGEVKLSFKSKDELMKLIKVLQKS